MAMQWQVFEVILTQGLDEKRDPKYTMQGKLQVGENMIFDKWGILAKRRGYDAINTTLTLYAEDVDEYLMHVAVHDEGELLILGGDTLYAVLDATDTVLPSGTSIVARGPAYRGNIWRQDIATSATGKDVEIGG